MKATALAFLWLALGAAPAVHADVPGVVVRTRLDPQKGVVVGQPVRLLVDVLFPDAMPRPPRVSVGDVPGAQILRFETQGVTTEERIDGKSYVGQRFEFVVFPRRGGTVDVQGAEVTLLDASAEVAGTAKGEARRIAVSVPPGIDASRPVIAANDLVATQVWAPDASRARLKPGDALVRTIRRQAPDLPAMGMPDLAFAAPDGVRIYVDPPRSEDRVDRGEVVGSRTDRVTYVFERPGSYDLPALTQAWWKLATQEAREETFLGTHVEVVAGPSSNDAGSRPDSTRTVVGSVAVLVAVGLLVAAMPSIRGRVVLRWRRLVAAERASERRARGDLRRIARSGNARATYRALEIWLGRLPVGVREEVERDVEFVRVAECLRRSLFGQGGSWSANQGHALISAMNKSRRDHASLSTAHTRSVLPPLNRAKT